MRNYSNIITFTENIRGVYSLDPSIGCKSGLSENKKGCYNDCYAARYSKKYGYDFSKTVLRYFKNESHKHKIINDINKIKLPFIRMGTSGDPSECWAHTLEIIKVISLDYQLSLWEVKKKEIVIITKHFKHLSDNQLIELSKYNICINTSISAFDNTETLKASIKQFERLKPYCKSVLRVVSADFNTENKEGKRLYNIQMSLFKKYNVLDTVLRVSKKNEYYLNGLINIKESKFLGKKCYVSKFNKKTYFGKCGNCIEKCGINLTD